MKKSVAMLTTFHSYLKSYSLCQVASMQLTMLKENGYKCRLIVREGAQGWDDKVNGELAFTPDYIIDNDGSSEGMEKRSGKTFKELVNVMYESFEKLLEGIDVIITHDLIFQSSNNIQDDAAAKYAEKHPDVRWLHWIHSATSPMDLSKKVNIRYRNSFICYPNSWDTARIARNFGYEIPDVKVVPHPMDYVRKYNMHPISERLVRETNLLDVDVFCIYPVRLDRGKQPEVIIRILNQMKTYCRKTIKLIIFDFQSTGGDKVKYRSELKNLAVGLGWNSEEITFMSEWDNETNLEVPEQVIMDMLILTNVFIQPSKSETYSLVVQEAITAGNVIVLNQDFPPMRSVYGNGPIYKQFSSAVNVITGENGATNTKYKINDVDGKKWPGVSATDCYMRYTAMSINYNLQNDIAINLQTKTRMTKNSRTVFKRNIEPLFYAENDLMQESVENLIPLKP